MRRDDAGYVTVEHAVCFAAVTLVIGVIAATVQAGLTGSSARALAPPPLGKTTHRTRPRPRIRAAPTQSSAGMAV